ncbi:MAG: hypothetical protein AAGI38_22570 [Bacteroidota bacterium]
MKPFIYLLLSLFSILLIASCATPPQDYVQEAAKAVVSEVSTKAEKQHEGFFPSISIGKLRIILHSK